MKSSRSAERLLRWYPLNWRARYGEGFAALLEDTYAQNLSWRARASIARAGLVERAREAGFVGVATSADDRLRTGSQLVLCGWALFMVAGPIFAKFTEHWGVATPRTHRTFPSLSIGAVHWAGGAGLLLVLLAGLFVGPAVIRLLRSAGWSRVRRSVLRSVSVLSAALLLTSAVVIWAQFLNQHQRNGGSVGYEVVVLLSGLVLMAALVTVTSTVISVTHQLDLSHRALQVLATTALAVTLSMVIVTAGTVAWWASEANYAPHFLANSLGSGLFQTPGTLPSALILSGLLMTLGLVTALAGLWRVAHGVRADTVPSLLSGEPR